MPMTAVRCRASTNWHGKENSLSKPTNCTWYINCDCETSKMPQATEGFMRSLFDLAKDYENWATHDEKIAAEIMNSVDGYPVGIRDSQLLRASLLAEEARLFREQAAKLRGRIADGRRKVTLKTDAHA